jgi:gram-positive specific serine protease
VPICLPISVNMAKPVVDKYTVAGFGFTENGRDSDVMLKVVLPKVSKESCQSFHGSVVKLSEGHECYGGESIKDSCKGELGLLLFARQSILTDLFVTGDSGNPLMNYVNVNRTLKAVQLGIVVAGHSQCGQGVSGFPGIYTDVNHYMEWILDNLYE